MGAKIYLRLAVELFEIALTKRVCVWLMRTQGTWSLLIRCVANQFLWNGVPIDHYI